MPEHECPHCYQEPGTYDDADGTLFFITHEDLDGQQCDGSDMAVEDDDDA